MSQITPEQKALYIKTAQLLKGSERRIFMASVVQALGRGGQRYAEREFGWNRRTVRKGVEELTSGLPKIDHFAARGRKRAEERLPRLLDDLREVVEGEAGAPAAAGRPTMRLSAAEVRRRLIEQRAYCDEALPCVATIGKKLKQLGYGRL